MTTKIFLASSAELKDDRIKFAIFIGRENKVWREQGVFLELVIWEDFIDAMSRTRLQDEYNRAIRECDVFVMLFFTKVGKYTAEEFETAYGHFQATGKPLVYTYFKDAPVSMGSIDAADFTSLTEFKQKLKDLGHFQTDYVNTEALLLHFLQQLDKLAAKDVIQFKQPASAGETTAEVQSVVTTYLNALAKDLGTVRLGEIDPSVDQSKPSPLQLTEIYVSLNTEMTLAEPDTLAAWTERGGADLPSAGKRRDGRFDQLKSRPVCALEAMATHRKLTLLGWPGSGKSTFGASVLLSLAQTCLGGADQIKNLGGHWKFGALLPIRVVLRKFADSLAAGDENACAGDLWKFIADDLKASGYGMSARTMEYVERIARDSGALILFDGLDECGDAPKRARVLAGIDQKHKRKVPFHFDCEALRLAGRRATPTGCLPTRRSESTAD